MGRFSRPAAGLAVAVLLIVALVKVSGSADEPTSKPALKKMELPSPLTWPAGKVIFQESEVAKQIRAALEKPAEFKFGPCTPLGDFVTLLEETTKIKFELDAEALAADGKGSDMPITKSGKYTSLANGLSRLLEGNGLTYLVKNDVLLITTKTAASAPENLTTRLYQVHDLVVAPNDPTATQPDFDSLIDVVTSSIRQQDWQDNGGTIGFIKSFNGPGMLSLIVTHDEQGHREIEQLLKMLRESRVQPVVEAQEKQPFKERPPPQVPFVISHPVVGAPVVTPPASAPQQGGGMF